METKIEKRILDFDILIWYSHADSAYIVEVPALPGCMADGKTQKEAFDNAKIAIQEWIDTARVMDRHI